MYAGVHLQFCIQIAATVFQDIMYYVVVSLTNYYFNIDIVRHATNNRLRC